MPSQAIGPWSHHLGHVVGGLEDRRVPEDQQRAARRLVDRWTVRLEDRRARALAADQGAGDVEAVLGQQLVEVEARDAPRDLRVALADEVGVAVTQVAQPTVDLARAGRRRRRRARARPRSSAPTRIRVPSYSAISSSSRLSEVRPAITECAPHELLPIMPPNVA